MSEERDPLEERLRAALAAKAEEVDPAADGLSRIRGRIAERRRHDWWARLRDQWMTRPAFAAVAAAGVIVLGLGATIGIGQATNVSIPGIPSSSSSSTESSDTSSEPTSAEPTSSEPGTSSHTSTPGTTKPKPKKVTVSVPVYRVTKTGDGYGVSQSSTSVRVTTGPKKQEEQAEQALKSIFDGGPQLRSTGAGVWQAGTQYEDADLRGSVLKVMLNSSAASGATSSPEAARAALKQVVFTGLGAAPSASSVQLLVGGSAVSSFWGLPVNPGGIQRGDSALTRPFNTITSPNPGSSHPAGSVKIGGDGAYDGGQVFWEIREPNGAVRKSGSASTGSTGFASWSAMVELEPGTYELRTFDKTGGRDAHVKSVSFTVTE